MRLSELLREYRRDHSLSQRDFAKQCGEKITSGYISMLENEKNPATGKKIRPSLGTYDVLARGMGITVDKLFNLINDVPVTLTDEETLPDNLIPISKINNGHRVPVIGSTAAGTPIIAEREWDEYFPAPDGRGRADAALRVDGDSMEPHYLDGDYVYIRYQDDVEDGQVAAVCIDDTVTLKKVYHIPNGIYLVSENAARHPPMTYTTDEVNNIHLLGLAVGFFRWEH